MSGSTPTQRESEGDNAAPQSLSDDIALSSDHTPGRTPSHRRKRAVQFAEEMPSSPPELAESSLSQPLHSTQEEEHELEEERESQAEGAETPSRSRVIRSPQGQRQRQTVMRRRGQGAKGPSVSRSIRSGGVGAARNVGDDEDAEDFIDASVADVIGDYDDDEDGDDDDGGDDRDDDDRDTEVAGGVDQSRGGRYGSSVKRRSRVRDEARGLRVADADDAEEDEIADGQFEEEDEEDGEDLYETINTDYKKSRVLDNYETEGIVDPDDMDEDPGLTAQQRRAAEAEMEERDRRRKGTTRDMPRLLQRDRDNLRNRVRDLESAAMEAEKEVINLEEMQGPIREWIVLAGPRGEVARTFRNFLATYVDKKGALVYAERIRNMCAANRKSLEVSYLHLSQTAPLLAMLIADAPAEVIPILDEVAYDVALEMFPNYDAITPEINIRISELPITDTLRDIRQIHLNALIKISGVVTRRTGVFPQLKIVLYDCVKCGTTIGPFHQNTATEITPNACPACQSKGPFVLNNEQTVYRNFQKITLQESPGTVPAGRLPRAKEVILLGDLIDSARPGEEIEITGIYKNNFDASLNKMHGFPVFATVIEANYISKRADDFATFRLTDEDIREIRRLSRDPQIGEKIINAIAPSIFGHEEVKTALALALFGGEPKEVARAVEAGEKRQTVAHRIRGDINLLILGDPGTAKSQFLKYAEKTSHRAVFATGQGASAVGLTASVHHDPVTKEWTLEGGALVLADKGLCLIDEFDKMNDQDRTSIHEAMEQQTISISKAGIVTSLQARCSVIAAANPIKGRYDPTTSFVQNVDLTDPILSRFDILCVVRDVVDPVSDEYLAEFVVNSHRRSHAENTNPEQKTSNQATEEISQDMLRKYMMYAKQRIHPRLTRLDQERISQVYADLRRESSTAGSIPITVRHVESMIRIAEAHARMHLREEVNTDDVNMAIRVALTSFINSQKHSVMKSMTRVFRRYLTYKRDNNELLLYVLQSLVRDYTQMNQRSEIEQEFTSVDIDLDDFVVRARELGVDDPSPFFNSDAFKSNRYILDKREKVIRKVF
eukprot:TRINITY_DN5063_c0_g1_i3.p1 TRINITY_DN5063_c0_g1~~TRINITY_DN5063_c0_g1_i3.p1  ORF type:complete len:1064 (+),score=262.09 TRINITY_DN5063_c0_g1_i3:63-3254(+)